MAEDRGDENIDQGPAWGWGWLSGAAQAAKDAFDSNVKPALQSMENSTAQFVQDVTRVIDLQIEEPEIPVEVDAERDKVPVSSYPADEVPRDVDVTEEPVDDSIFSDVSGGFTYIGDMVKKISTQISDIDQVEATLKRGSEKLKTALNEAYQFITEDEEGQQSASRPRNDQSGPQTPGKSSAGEAERDAKLNNTTPSQTATPSSSSTVSTAPGTPSTPSSNATGASPTFASAFAAKLGNIDFAALENMSMQSSLQLQKILRKLTDDQRAIVLAQQEELRAIFAPDDLSEGSSAIDFATITLPESEIPSSSEVEVEESLATEQDTEAKRAREAFMAAAASHSQKLSFFALRSSQFHSWGLKFIANYAVPEDGDIKSLSESVLSFRGKMQLDVLRQMAEFTALVVHQIVLAAEYANASQKNSRVDMLALAKIVHLIALSSKANAATIALNMIASMKAIGNAFKDKAANAPQHPEKQAIAKATLKRISSGMNSVHFDLPTAVGTILDASRFTLALFQYLKALELE